MRLRTTITVFAAACAGTLVGVLLGSAGAVVAEDYDPAFPPVVTGCVIRFYPDGPAIHENGDHTCTGANSVSVEADGDLYVDMDWHGAVIALVVEEDESLVRRGILAGPSDGLSEVTIRFFDVESGESVRADDDRLACANCNIWFLAVNVGSVLGPQPAGTRQPRGY